MHEMPPNVLVGVCLLPGGLGDGAFHISTPVTGVRNLEQILVLFKYLRWSAKTIEDFVIVADGLRVGESLVQSRVRRLRSSGTAGPHRDCEVFLLQLLNEGRLSQSLLVRPVLLPGGHQDVIKCPLRWLQKDIPSLNKQWPHHFGTLPQRQQWCST